MKKSAIFLNLLRAVFIVLAYKEIAHPKAAIIPPGTGRSMAYYLKSCYQISKSWVQHTAKRLVKHASAAL